jgi:hypothetical protein
LNGTEFDEAMKHQFSRPVKKQPEDSIRTTENWKKSSDSDLLSPARALARIEKGLGERIANKLRKLTSSDSGSF